MRTKKTFQEWLRSRDGQKVMVMLAFMTIPLLMLFVFTYLPFASMIKFSFYKMKYVGPRTFVGWDNYIKCFTRKDLWQALGNSLYYMGAAIVQLFLALFLATILSFKVKGSNFFKGAMFFPYMINGMAVGYIFKYFFTRGMVLDSVLGILGFNMDTLPRWLMDQSINNYSLAASAIWRYVGQNMVLFIGAIASVDPQLYEAATLDGANKFQQFRYVILPGIRTIITLNLILSITGGISAFEQSYVISKGANGTTTYFVLMDQVAHELESVGYASAMAIILMIIIIIFAVLQKLFFKYVFRSAEDEDPNAGKKREKKLARLAAREARKENRRCRI